MSTETKCIAIYKIQRGLHPSAQKISSQRPKRFRFANSSERFKLRCASWFDARKPQTKRTHQWTDEVETPGGQSQDVGAPIVEERGWVILKKVEKMDVA
jgi:hypothetical protein